jgi:hypothetical protein
VTRFVLALLALVAIGAAPVATTVCAWSCATSHHSAQTARHHDCEEPATDVDQIASDALCAEHAGDGAPLAVGSVAAYSAPSFDGGVFSSQSVTTDHFGPLMVPHRGADPPSTQRRSILRI